MVEEKLDLTYYSGEDLYSDGAVEDELLEAVKNPSAIERQLMGGNSWAHLYHLSNIRENILEWYDFNPEGELLEIGSGCGALSGLFCRKVKHVTAIELSKKRSTINALRNDEYKNLTIMLGNFEDIRLTKKFDYVTLIGVFEYSICYINSENPFMDMLERAKRFLKPGGRLFIAIENKYGLKYFAGATEDHTGRCFDGLENYVGVERVRTFSRGTLLKMLGEAGFTDNEFYYPTADYKLPDEIYSDRHLPSFGSIRKPCTAYDRERYELINENQAFDALCEDGLFTELANSFLVISKAQEASGDTKDFYVPKTVEYAKYNRLRAPKYQICTRIITDTDGTKYVEKQALRTEANEHIRALLENRRKLLALSDSVVPVEVLEQSDGRINFPFVRGKGLIETINKNLSNMERLKEAIEDALARMFDFRPDAYVDFVPTDAFSQVFGVETFSLRTRQRIVSLKATNIDTIFENYIVEESTGECVILDYEWVFDFPVPLDYLKYRTIYYYYSKFNGYLAGRISEAAFLEEFGITGEMAEQFAKMENGFQQYVHGENRKYIYTTNYQKPVHNIGKNLQMNEGWFCSVVRDLDALNHTLGPNRRDLVTARIRAHRKSEFWEKVRRNAKHPLRGFMKMLRK